MIERPWAFWRRVQYGAGFFCVLALIGVGLYFKYGYSEPTCFDQIKNADERGVDCGGVCTRICAFDITVPSVLWTQSFKIIDGQYNAVAYVENRNKNVGAEKLRYTVKLFDSQGLIIEREGTTVLPPDSVYPVFEGRIMTGDRIPTRTELVFASDISWIPGTVGREQFTLEKRELKNADSKPRLIADLYNTSLEEAQDVEIVATIFDARGNALTSARTIVPYFAGRTTKSVEFTWPEPIAKTLRSCEIPTDVVLAIDLSGSMNEDGGIPPEPITSVLISGESFVSQLNPQDQIGLVTYATNAIVKSELTHESERIADEIIKLRIDPKEEQGSTNTGDALRRMQEELGSVRHNPDARKIAILLTDGLATAPKKDPEPYALQEAEALKALGVEVFTVGLGEKVNEAFLKQIASSDTQYYNAPTTGELKSIYSSITEDICEDGATVIEIVPKSKSSFAPAIKN